ncbi:hypothetical protein EVAR_17143_1 [Eumeta japonica]|uniref:Uncharacterized protein n=1 Tax=Eumeta variegata TaxID=151549 RepID=A0A4C1ULX1_EUMVA|nr:hypothetical protein EVAR_17143_1 [Eumeta japonica]
MVRPRSPLIHQLAEAFGFTESSASRMRKHRSGIVGHRRVSSGAQRCLPMAQTAFEYFWPRANKLKRVASKEYLSKVSRVRQGQSASKNSGHGTSQPPSGQNLSADDFDAIAGTAATSSGERHNGKGGHRRWPVESEHY